MNSFVTYEFGDWINIDAKSERLKEFLISIKEDHKEWLKNYYDNILEEIKNDEEIKERKQNFLSFDGSKIKARNYIGFIQYEDILIEIYPKVFKNFFKDENKQKFLGHIFYWLSYCKNLQFPVTKADLDKHKFDTLPDIFIYFITKSILSVISQEPYSNYEEVFETLETPRGRIDFTSYITKQMSRGNWHKINCVYEPFLYDNTLNQVIKYVLKILRSYTKNDIVLSIINDSLFILDEVTDRVCTVEDIQKIKINRFFEEYQKIIFWCKMILQQQIYFNNNYENSQFCFLLPMELIYEQFIAGFVQEKFSDYKINSQHSKYFLSSDPEAFNLQIDLFLEDKKIIIDTKYKCRNKKDNKEGVAQSDMYQMLSYAYRAGVENVFLLYPNFEEMENINRPVNSFIIKSENSKNSVTKVRCAEIPIWSLSGFDELDNKLKERLEKLLVTITNLPEF